MARVGAEPVLRVLVRQRPEHAEPDVVRRSGSAAPPGPAPSAAAAPPTPAPARGRPSPGRRGACCSRSGAVPSSGSSSTPTLLLAARASPPPARGAPPRRSAPPRRAPAGGARKRSEQRSMCTPPSRNAAQRRLLRARGIAEAAVELVDPVIVRLDDRPRPGLRLDEVAQERIGVRRHPVQRDEAHHHPVRARLEPAGVARQHGLEELGPLDRQRGVVGPRGVLVGPHVLQDHRDPPRRDQPLGARARHVAHEDRAGDQPALLRPALVLREGIVAGQPDQRHPGEVRVARRLLVRRAARGPCRSSRAGRARSGRTPAARRP